MMMLNATMTQAAARTLSYNDDVKHYKDCVFRTLGYTDAPNCLKDLGCGQKTHSSTPVQRHFW